MSIKEDKNKQIRIAVSFRKKADEEIELYNWLLSKSKVSSVSSVVREILYQAMLEDKDRGL